MWLCRIGTEHEKFGFQLSTLNPITYEQIAQLLDGIAERFHWERVLEDNKIIGLKLVSIKTYIFRILLLCKHSSLCTIRDSRCFV
jgi:gamma-glutamylcysteine synthetase